MDSSDHKSAGYYSFSREEIIEYIKPYIMDLLAAHGVIRVLDVGCGTGAFGSALMKSQSNILVDGVEIEEAAAAAAARKLRKVFNTSFDENFLGVVEEKYEAIFFNDSFEHMSDSVRILSIAKRIAREDTIFVFSIPNMRHLRVLIELIVGKDWRYREAGILDNTHVRFFTKKSFERLLNENGLKIDRIIGLNATKKYLYRFVFWLFDVITLWTHQDIKHRQFLFIARRRH